MAKQNADKEKENTRSELFKIEEDSYSGDYYGDLLKEYQLYVGIMDETSARRQNANNFFLALNSLIITIMGVFLNRADCPLFISLLWMTATSIFGILLCLRWREIIQEYKNLNSGRFFIIHLLEERLPAKLFKAEWDYLRPPEKPRYGKLTVAEMDVPIYFVILYILLIVIGFVLLSSPNVHCSITDFFNSTSV